MIKNITINKSLYSRKLEHKNPLDHYLKHVVVCDDFHIVLMFASQNGGGYYEVWNQKTDQSINKSNFAQIEQMCVPWECEPGQIGFIHEDTLQLNTLKFKEDLCIQNELQLPSMRLRDFMGEEISEDFKPTYLKNCLQLCWMKSKILIIIEQFNTFNNPDGNTEEVYMSSWKDDIQLGEISIESSHTLQVRELNEQLVVIYKQYFDEQDLVFYIWDPTQCDHKEIEISTTYKLNGVIINVFLNLNQTIIKAEQPQLESQELCFVCNSNNHASPLLLFLLITNNQVSQYRHQYIELHNAGSVLHNAPVMINQDLLLHYYTKSHHTVIGVFNYIANTHHTILGIKHNDRFSDIFFGKTSKHFLEIYDDMSQQHEPQVQDIKLPDQTEQITQFIEHSFIPYPILVFHYLYSKRLHDTFHKDNIFMVLDMLFQYETKQENKHEIN